MNHLQPDHARVIGGAHLYEGIDEADIKIVDVFICKLRKKLSVECDGENYIETVWARGYVLRDPEQQVVTLAA